MIRRHEWAQSELELLGRELAGATVGLVGFGRIARRVMHLLRGFEVRLLMSSRSGALLPRGVARREHPDLLAASDFVSIHVPLTTETRYLIYARALAQMRRGAILVNTSRGAVVDTTALIDALKAGHLGAAGLDVSRASRTCRRSSPTTQHGAAAPPGVGHRRHQKRDGAPVRPERDLPSLTGGSLRRRWPDDLG